MRVLFLLVLLAVVLITPPWISIPVVVIYMFMYTAYELVLLAMLIDAQFGIGFSYIYTAVALVLLVSIEYLKPFLTFYKSRA